MNRVLDQALAKSQVKFETHFKALGEQNGAIIDGFNEIVEQYKELDKKIDQITKTLKELDKLIQK